MSRTWKNQSASLSLRPQSFTVRSCPPLTIHFPSRLISTLATGPVCPCNVCINDQSSAEKMFTLLSKPLEAKKVLDFFGSRLPFSSRPGCKVPSNGSSSPLYHLRSDTALLCAPIPPVLC